MHVLEFAPRLRAGVAIIGISAGLALAGCSDVPTPFAHDGPSDSPLLHLADSTGIVVMPSAYAPPDTSEQLADALAAALGAANVPASVAEGHPGSYRLQSHATVRKLDDWREEILLYWELRDNNGRRVGNLAQTFRAWEGDWNRAMPGTLNAIATVAAPQIAAMIQEKPIVATPVPGIFVMSVSGAPGDGNAALAAALKARLRDAGITLADADSTGQVYTVQGVVSTTPPADGVQSVAVSWQVWTPDAEEIGSVDQTNQVPMGLLDGAWGQVAGAVADAAVAGIAARWLDPTSGSFRRRSPKQAATHPD